MNILNRYFRNSAKSLLIECEISDLYKKIRQLRKKQTGYYAKNSKDEVEVRKLFDEGVFKSYKDQMMIFFKKLQK